MMGGAVYFQESNNEIRGFSKILYFSGGYGGHGWLETVIGDLCLYLSPDSVSTTVFLRFRVPSRLHL